MDRMLYRLSMLFTAAFLLFVAAACETTQVKDEETLQQAKEEALEGNPESWTAIEKALAEPPPAEAPNLHTKIIDEAGDIDKPEARELLQKEATSQDLKRRNLAYENLDEQKKFGNPEAIDDIITQAIADNQKRDNALTKDELQRLGMTDSDLARATLRNALGKDPQMDPLVLSAIAGHHADLTQKIKTIDESPPPQTQPQPSEPAPTKEPAQETKVDTPQKPTESAPEQTTETAPEKAEAAETKKKKKKDKPDKKTEPTTDQQLTAPTQPPTEAPEKATSAASPQASPETSAKSQAASDDGGAQEPEETKAEPTREELTAQQRALEETIANYIYSVTTPDNRRAALDILYDNIYTHDPHLRLYHINRESAADDDKRRFVYEYLAGRAPAFARDKVASLRTKYLDDPSARNPLTLFELSAFSGQSIEGLKKELDGIIKQRADNQKYARLTSLSTRAAIVEILSPYGLSTKTLSKMEAHYKGVIDDNSVPQRPESQIAYAAMKTIYPDMSYFEIKSAAKKGFDNRLLFTSAMDIVLYDYSRDDLRVLVMQDLFGLDESLAKRILHGYRRERWLLKKINL